MATIPQGILLPQNERDGYVYGNLNKTGVYVFLEVLSRITAEEISTTGRRHRFIMPLREDSFTTPTDQQEFFAPIEDLFKEISAVIGGLGANWISGIADMVVKFQDLFGTKLFNSSLHAQAWRQARPSSLSLKLDFNYGMLDEWNANIEVMRPLLIIKRCALPLSIENGTFYAPGPTAISVYKEFGQNIFKTVSAQSEQAAEISAQSNNSLSAAAREATATNISNTYAGVVRTGSKLLDAATAGITEALSSSGYWAVSLLAFNSAGGGQAQLLYQSPRMICKESTISFGNQLDETLCPISGSATLALSSQMPTDSLSFKSDTAWGK